VYETAQGIRRHEPQEPQEDENNSDGVEHGRSFPLFEPGQGYSGYTTAYVRHRAERPGWKAPEARAKDQSAILSGSKRSDSRLTTA
jgi:hypothetical protein